MATVLVSPRDIDLFQTLERTPLTVRQLLKLSATFAYPFTTERRVQERVQQLCAAGRLRRWFYATAGQGALSYFTLTRESYRLLHGPEVPMPSKGMFRGVGLARERHTRALAEFLVHLFVGIHLHQVELQSFHRENSLALRLGDETLYPDSAFSVMRGEEVFRFFVEIDNSTESVRSSASLDTWQRKIGFYERYQSAQLDRFRVLAVTTGGPERRDHILECARREAKEPRRSLVYAVGLRDFLAESSPLSTPFIRDHHGREVSLLPAALAPLFTQTLRSPSFAGAQAASMIGSAACLEPLPQA